MKRLDLLEALDRVKMPLTEAKMIQFAGLLIFESDLLISYGDNISVSVFLETGVKAAIKYEKFVKLIKKIKEDEIELEVNDKQLIVKYGKESEVNFSLVAYDQDKIPNLGVDKIKEMPAVSEDFAPSLGFACFSAGGNSGIELLTNVKVHKDKVISTDKFRITSITLSKKVKLKNPLLVPQKIAQFLSSFNINAVVVDGNCAHYQDDQDTIFTHRLIDDSNYPDVDKFTEVDGKNIEFPKELIQQLDQAQQVVEDGEDITLIIDKNKIVVGVKSSDASAILPLDYKYKGKKIKMEVSADYLLQILGKSRTAIVNEDVMCFKGENFIHLISLMD